MLLIMLVILNMNVVLFLSTITGTCLYREVLLVVASDELLATYF